jgi:hypothetical protein
VKYIWIYGAGTASGVHEFTDIFVEFVYEIYGEVCEYFCPLSVL